MSSSRYPARVRYINLARSTGRRALMEEQLAHIGLGGCFERFEAVDGSGFGSGPRSGEAACYQSHKRLVEQAAQAGEPTHIVEDDAVLSPELLTELPQLLAGDPWQDYDLVFTEVGINPYRLKELTYFFDAFRQARNSGRTCLVSLAPTSFAGAVSYLLNPAGAQRLLAALAPHEAAKPSLPWDLRLRMLVQSRAIRAAVLMPFLSSIRAEGVDTGSAIRPLEVVDHTSRTLLTSLRQGFYRHSSAEALSAQLPEMRGQLVSFFASIMAVPWAQTEAFLNTRRQENSVFEQFMAVVMSESGNPLQLRV